MTTDFDNKKYTGSFNTKNVEEALHAVTWPLGLEHSIDTKGINGRMGVTFKLAE